MARRGLIPAPCGVPLVRLVLLTALEDAGLKPHPDKPEDSWISDPVRQHPQQPLVVDRVEEAACAATAPLMDPEIEDVVQKDVGEERTDARPLRGTPVRLLLLAALKNAGPQPQLYQPQ